MPVRAALVLTLLALASPALAAETLQLEPGGVEVVRTGRGARTVAIGDPRVADAAVINETTVMITGKANGTSSMVLLDEKGAEILRRTLRVGPAQMRVHVFDGTPKGQTYLCRPTCSAESDEGRTTTSTTVVTRNEDARNPGAPAGAPTTSAERP